MGQNLVRCKIKEYRMRRGLTQAQLSKQMIDSGVYMEQKILSQIETRNRNVYDYELVGFAKVLDIKIEDLL